MTDTQKAVDGPSSTPHLVPGEVTATSAVFYPTGGTLGQKLRLLRQQCEITDWES